MQLTCIYNSCMITNPDIFCKLSIMSLRIKLPALKPPLLPSPSSAVMEVCT